MQPSTKMVIMKMKNRLVHVTWDKGERKMKKVSP